MEVGVARRYPRPHGASRVAHRRRALGFAAATGVGAFVPGQRPPKSASTKASCRNCPPWNSATGKPPPIQVRASASAQPERFRPRDDCSFATRSSCARYAAAPREGNGDIEAAALQELIDPGSVDLDMRPSTANGPQVHRPRPRPGLNRWQLAYDWLYGHWSDAQRMELRGKLTEACDYLIERIRKERMSPYNVILYNAPLQALMACSLALYGDDPRGDPVMRFTYDLWKNRRAARHGGRSWAAHGGWHEGGEYVGIGIGQAIYELPAMWRSATARGSCSPANRASGDF